MIKFLLHGGMTTPRTEKNRIFFQRVVEMGGNNILIFPFAQKNKEYKLQFDIDKQKFIDNNPNIDLNIAMASTDISILTQQIKDYPSLYFGGGLEDHHLEILHQIKDMRTLLDNKIISGNSAGSLIWSNAFFSGDDNSIKQGINLLPIKLMVHRQSEKYSQYNNDALHKLEKFGEELPVYTIREQEYEYFEI